MVYRSFCSISVLTAARHQPSPPSPRSWIGRAGLVEWPPKSANLTQLDLFLRFELTFLLYPPDDPLQTPEKLEVTVNGLYPWSCERCANRRSKFARRRDAVATPTTAKGGGRVYRTLPQASCASLPLPRTNTFLPFPEAVFASGRLASCDPAPSNATINLRRHNAPPSPSTTTTPSQPHNPSTHHFSPHVTAAKVHRSTTSQPSNGPQMAIHDFNSNVYRLRTASGGIQLHHGGHRSAVPRALASHQGEPGLIPGSFNHGFSHVGIVPDDAAVGRFSGGPPVFPALEVSQHSILTSIHIRRYIYMRLPVTNRDYLRLPMTTCDYP
ncbi:hypothetical protein PR048_005818 [Dryococelus australis]|uniref:Uncharacterized protein n=1 Tax=Dryococelus australis TaxID=614101 RepID=A0ABQ9IAG7_9NEOP|nr:hypothetical protein PR048_005818 [Dryococelus australis]